MKQSAPSKIELDSTAFSDIIGTYVPLMGSKEAPYGYCPLCHGDEHQFRLFPRQLSWQCDDCGEEGDIYYFFEKLRKIPHEDAVRFADIIITNQMRKKSSEDRFADISSRIRFPAVKKHPKSKSKSKSKIRVNTEAIAKFKSRYHSTETTLEKDEPEANDATEAETEKAVVTLPSDPNTQEGFIQMLLEKFKDHDGFNGIAALQTEDSKVLGSNIKNLETEDLEILDQFFQSSISGSQAFLGDFDTGTANTMIAMDITHHAEDFSLLWLPMNNGAWPANILLLLKQDAAGSIYVMQLKNQFK
jgi:hypothetical protein